MKYFDWKKALLNYYKDLDLNEVEVTLIYLMDFINSEKEQIITPDLLALKSTLKYDEIDDILNDLMTKKYINLKSSNGKMITSLDTIKEMLFELYLLDVNKNKKASNEFKEEFDEILTTIETNFERKLNFIERNKIEEWINDGYRKDNIFYALKQTMNKKDKSINSMDNMLLTWKKQDERSSEGYTTITDRWHKDIRESSHLTGLDFEDEDKQ